MPSEAATAAILGGFAVASVFAGLLFAKLLYYCIETRPEKARQRREQKDLEAQRVARQRTVWSSRAGNLNTVTGHQKTTSTYQPATVEAQRQSIEVAREAAEKLAKEVSGEDEGKFRRWVWKVTGR
ncbi:hypothetical protein CLAFUW4_13191 [Fulvia fulva]|uniref:Uncharacterized protein n=1 Tax=Passalora fulva TaxID=5499 RepID=A0A9Q8PK57_PASFU|nr:uncharacterized protein CLAFUR5_13048 [Fulvia fulva]KAK4611677.1 hypothetical protein CLAFUR4_13196 [Fulvia fulva]KAK4612464.1 hypothetical protein CLAFUR0_13200 [Fulvia fulva]UJO23902.1 hypothetical protein CLAFUR5_13048 [Fulvia fulva]WPV21273.1 hypothetical protein CLAFUW4_13191 [Fulvia fulva]WPV36251.1 hypothetical protein CLAFUW7_13199 [Fulvia fulva]